MLPDDNRYGLFAYDGGDHVCEALFADLGEAKRQAQNLAEREGRQYFVFDFSRFVEVARFHPRDAA